MLFHMYIRMKKLILLNNFCCFVENHYICIGVGFGLTQTFWI